MYKNTSKPGMPIRLYHKIMLIMRLTTVLLIASLIQVSAAGFAQKISMNVSNISLKAAIKTIRSQSGYNFVYTQDVFKNTKPVSINVKDAEFSEVIEQIFNNQPLSYQIENKTVVVKQKETTPTLIENLTARFQEIDVHGRVVDEQGRSIPGATVRVKNGKGAAITDAKGEFVIKGVSESSTLIISFIGYNAKELPANSDLSIIALEVATSKLDEVKVLAYSKTSERLSTGNTVSIKAEDIAKSPVDNPILALKGRVPGLEITQNSGLANAGVTIRIQGQNSLGKGNDPFFVIDGVPYTSQLLLGINNERGGNGNSPTPSGAGNPLAFINPSDIESIDILKDAEATAIYGSRAANGAVLITTKKGKAGDTKIEANVQSGWAQNSRRLKLMNTEQYLSMRLQAKVNDNLPVGVGPYGVPDYDLLGKYGWSLDRTSDWQKELIGNTAHYTDAQLGISGGNANTQFLVSGNFKRQTTVMPTDLADRKASMHFSLNNTSTNQRLQFQLTGSYLDDQNEMPSVDLTNIAQQLPPNAPLLYNSDGSLNWAPDENGNTTFFNPLRAFEINSRMNTNNLVANSTVSYQLFKGLSLKNTLGYSRLHSRESKATPLTYFAPSERVNRGSFGRFLQLQFNEITSLNIDPQLQFQHTLLGGTISAILGGNYNRVGKRGEGFFGYGFSSDLLINNIGAASSLLSVSNYLSQYKYAAVYLQGSYNFQDKYLLNFSIRRDGSSRFGSENVLHDFASVSGAWLFSNERWLKESLPLLSYGKLKVSYGTTGNDQIGDYQALDLYLVNSQRVNYQGITTLKNERLSNPYLQWELTSKVNVGLDLGFFNDRLLINANYYRNRSSNQILDYNISSTTGFQAINRNFPATIENSGLELNLNTINFKKELFNWSTNLNLTVPHNKLIAFPGLESSGYKDALVLGQPISISKLFHYRGVDPETGAYAFETKEGQVTSSTAFPIDASIIADVNPKYYAGLSNTIGFKRFSLDILFQYTKQKNIQRGILGSNTGMGYFEMTDYSVYGNQPIGFLDSWKKDGDRSQFRAFSTDPFNEISNTSTIASNSDAAFVNSSFVRLTNLSLAYQLPISLVSKAKITSARIYAQGQNLWTVTSFNGLDPDGNFSQAIPPLKIFTFGLQITL